MIVVGRPIVERYLSAHRDRVDIGATQRRFDAWSAEVRKANWRTPVEVKRLYRHASAIGANRVVFNIAGNKYRLIADIDYVAGVVAIVFFGTHAEYDRIDTRTVR